MFRKVPLSIIRSFSLCTQPRCMSYRIKTEFRSDPARKLSANLYDVVYVIQDQDGDPSWSCSQAISKLVWQIQLLCVQWKTPDDGQRNCPNHVDFQSKNKLEKLVHPVGFIIRTEYIQWNLEVCHPRCVCENWEGYVENKTMPIKMF